MLTVGDLLAEQALGLRLVAGSAGAARRRVLGAAVVEVEAPARWIERHWVLLTAGVRLEGASDGELRELVADCDEAGLAALAFGEGPVFDELPAALLDEGEARGYPILAVPLTTPFRAVVRFVDAALMGDEAPLFRRLASLQRFVVDALREPEPETAVVERLARFLDASVALLDGDGRPGLVRGSAPLRDLWDAMERHPPAAAVAEAAGWYAVAAPLASGPGEPPRWLLLASRREGFIGTLARRAAETTAPLLVAIDRLGELGRRQELAVREALLGELLAPDGDAAELAARAAAFGIDFAEPARVVVARGSAAILRHELEDALAGAPHLLAERDGAVVALVQGEPREALEPALRGEAVAGVGRPIEDVAGAPVSLRDAELAAARAAPGAVAAFEDLDLPTLLVSETPPERFEAKVEELVSALREHPPLREALVAYFDHDLDAVAAAAALHLHPNSLRYRLGRVEELLGSPVKRPATIAALHLALLAEPRTHPRES